VKAPGIEPDTAFKQGIQLHQRPQMVVKQLILKVCTNLSLESMDSFYFHFQNIKILPMRFTQESLCKQAPPLATAVTPPPKCVNIFAKSMVVCNSGF
jgi:hypothetical protein